MIRDEDGVLTGYVFVDTGGRATGDYIAAARKVLDAQLKLPQGYVVSWSGQFESAQRVRAKLMVAVPVTLGLILLLLYSSTRSAAKTMIVILAVPFSAVGAVWLVYLLGYNMNVAVWVGLIALLGVDAETGVFMLLYLDLAFEKARRSKAQLSESELVEAVVEGAAKRLRPKFMTFAIMTIGLAPILWSTGTGSAILKRIAAPMVGGIVTSFVLELLVYPPFTQSGARRGGPERRSRSASYLLKEREDLCGPARLVWLSVEFHGRCRSSSRSSVSSAASQAWNGAVFGLSRYFTSNTSFPASLYMSSSTR